MNNLIFLSIIDVNFANFAGGHSLIMTIVLVSFALAGILRSKRMLLIQLLLFGTLITVNEVAVPVLFYLFMLLQITLGLFMIYKVHRAINRNYLLVMEKTHQLPRDITSNGDNGTQSSF